MGKETKYFCDLCDAELTERTSWIVKVSGTGGDDWENEIYVCAGHRVSLKGDSERMVEEGDYVGQAPVS